MTNPIRTLWLVVCFIGLFVAAAANAQPPQYEIISLGLVGESVSGGQAVSENGQFVGGFTDANAFIWQSGVGSNVQPSVSGQPFNTPWGINNSGTMVGVGATTPFGSSPIPVSWQNGVATALGLPAGEILGRAYAINNNGMIVGSVDGGSNEQAAVFSSSGAGMVLTQTTQDGGILRTAYGINDSGRIVGVALDPNNAAATIGFYLDPGAVSAQTIGALTALGHNSSIAFDLSSNGLITGSSSFNGGVDGRAFLWSETGGMIEIPLPTGTSTASGRGVNADGWVVGTAGGLFAVPFLFDGNATYSLQDLIVLGGNGWVLDMSTSSGAFAIADNGTIIGRGMLNGQLTAFAMRPISSVPEPGSVSLLGIIAIAMISRRRRE